MSLSVLDWSLIGGGCVLVIGAAVLTYCCCVRKRRAKDPSGENAALIQSSDFNTDVKNSYSESSSDWRFGELDYAGVKRIVQWLADVRQAQSRNGGVDPIVEDVVIEQTLLGQQYDIGSPPQGYSPRVSAIGSDDGGFRRHGRDPIERDPLQR
ncbi:membrane-associated protein, putative [Bodo saltans]|uniref:Membrane-associated protein, putative n=1 Tax=Bodo saltans TaxID=75058 RepID=A0A0S4IKG3_BODSA|nr:membrane-associated protein, putative [Bodo saltans]|eukprot:CUF07864.1 membrane-associated protein, putative [Bodo saltans]